ncbi:MAG: transcription termination/antitermination protein NusG [Puniceicoccales bacterium]|jgi:transcriptional antiterminator NusG|nr:transcription termination/antitermination protein NusG [Puniceicoccales bacterium]
MDDETLEELETVFNEGMLLPKWFVLQTLSNQESKVKDAIHILEKEHNFGDIIQEVLVPAEKITEIKNGKKYSRVRKFYPGYVFIKMKMYDDAGKFLEKPFSLVKSIPGVVRFVGNRDPVALKQDEIDNILAKVEAVSGQSTPKTTYDLGETVKINDGPFLNLTGTIEGIDTEEGRLRVNVSMFGRSTPVDLEFWQVRRCADGEN